MKRHLLVLSLCGLLLASIGYYYGIKSQPRQPLPVFISISHDPGWNIGDTTEHLISVQGMPDGIQPVNYSGRPELKDASEYRYGSSKVWVQNGKIIGYRNCYYVGQAIGYAWDDVTDKFKISNISLLVR